jgi:hypothetical protein
MFPALRLNETSSANDRFSSPYFEFLHFIKCLEDHGKRSPVKKGGLGMAGYVSPVDFEMKAGLA